MTLEEIVQESGLKKGWLAKRLGITTPTLAAYTRYHRPLPAHHIRRLAGLLHVSSEELVQAAYGKWL